MEKIYNFVNKFFNFWPMASDFEKGFRCAMVLAALIFLLLILLGIILKLIFRKPSVSGVTLAREDGDIFISRNAIYTAICRLESEFPQFDILKVVMQRNRHKELQLTVTVLFDQGSKSFDMSAAEFKQRVFDMLSKSFGINNVKSVSIILAKIPGRNEDDFDEETAPVVSNAFVSGV